MWKYCNNNKKMHLVPTTLVTKRTFPNGTEIEEVRYVNQYDFEVMVDDGHTNLPYRLFRANYILLNKYNFSIYNFYCFTVSRL